MAMRDAQGSDLTKQDAADQRPDDKQLTHLLKCIGAVVIVCALAVVGAYVFKFGGKLPTEYDKWGQLGDYIGGLLNPVVGMATVVLVIISITIQRRELRASLGELKSANQATARMSFEQSLFAWLSNYRELVQAVHAGGDTGRSALTTLYRSYLAFPQVFSQDDIRRTLGKPVNEAAAFIYVQSIKWDEQDVLGDLDRLVRIARERYQIMYGDLQTELDALPRTMYRLLLWIDGSPLSPTEKWHYAALVRAQLSWTELVLFFYNCYSEDGKAFASVANRFALFDNLLPGEDVLVEHVRRLPERQIVAPLEPRAFNSKLAKNAMGIPG